MNDFLQFWAKAADDLHRHPDDAAALNDGGHAFALDTLVGPWMGPLRTASVVLLTLNPGFSGVEAGEALMPAVRTNVARNLAGQAPLPNFATNPAGRRWTEARLAQFDLGYSTAADKVAFVNLMPYRSREGGKDRRMLDRLTSVQMVRSLMRDTLFPEARAGKRVVVCLRSARDWGLEPNSQQGEALFAPQFTRSGFIFHVDRDRVASAVRRAVWKTGDYA
jgi:hypothetical protein